MAITQSDFMVVIKAGDAGEFAKDVAEVTRRGFLPVAGQWAWFQDGLHVAYYVDVSKTRRFVASPEGDHALPKESSELGAAKPAVEAQAASPQAVAAASAAKDYSGDMYA